MTLITETAYAICAIIGAGVIWMLAAGYRDHWRCKRYQLEMKMGKTMTKEKTIREWLETLPDGYRERAIKNCDVSCQKSKVNSLSHAVLGACHWKSTPEGFEFWNAVYIWAYGDGELPPLPEEK